MNTITLQIFLALFTFISFANVESIIIEKDLNTDLSDQDLFLGQEGETGFIGINSQNDELFYWFFPARDNQDQEPLVIWLTGGPGCSSELALFMENGPLKIDPVTLKLSLNPYSWNKKANLLYVDQPIGTGFSNPVHASFDVDENQISADFYIFLTKWISNHPTFKHRELFIIGESYAGHFVPAISAFIAKQGNRNNNNGINFVGFGIGNGYINAYHQYPAYATYAYQNHIISKTRYNALRKVFAECQTNIRNQDAELIWYDCQGGLQQILGYGAHEHPFNIYDIREECKYPPLCYDMSYVDRFLQQEQVIRALKVAGRQWMECNPDVYMALLQDIFRDSSSDIAYLLENGYKGILYFGDRDFICNWVGGLEVANHINWSRRKEFNEASFKQWRNYGEYKQVGALTFLKVYEAGHLVPMDQPAAALDLLENFIKSGAVFS